jgi:hypothetical protein
LRFDLGKHAWPLADVPVALASYEQVSELKKLSRIAKTLKTLSVALLLVSIAMWVITFVSGAPSVYVPYMVVSFVTAILFHSVSYGLSCCCVNCAGVLERQFHRESGQNDVRRSGMIFICHSCKKIDNDLTLDD